MKCMDPDNSAVWQLLPTRDHKLDIEGGESPTPTESGVLSSNGTLAKCPTVPRNMCLNGYSKEREHLSPRFRHTTRVLAGRQRKRVILKNGGANISRENVSKRSQRYLQDIFTTMVDIQWRWNLLVFAMGFFVSWIVFAVIWWIIAYAHGDLENADNEEWKPCVANVKNFVTAFLFSVESQHTIGYGFRYTTEECAEGVFMMCIQSVTGVMIQCLVAGMVFAKIARPKKRIQTLMFSRYAVVCLRDGKLCLMWRVGDMRKSHIIGAQTSAQLIKRKITTEGEVIPYYHTQLDVKSDDAGDRVFLIWPATIVHEIDERSPFFGMSAEDILTDAYELVVTLEGTIESTGQSIQARTSFVPTEILWGHRFEQVVEEEGATRGCTLCGGLTFLITLLIVGLVQKVIKRRFEVSYHKDTGEFLVDYRKFNSTYEIETPLCSARDYYEYRRAMVSSSRAVSYCGVTTEGVSMGSFRRCESTPEAQSTSSQVQVPDSPRSGSLDEC